MDHALRTISYIADIGDILVIMARRGPVLSSDSDDNDGVTPRRKTQTKVCCHVFETEEVRMSLLLCYRIYFTCRLIAAF